MAKRWRKEVDWLQGSKQHRTIPNWSQTCWYHRNRDMQKQRGIQNGVGKKTAELKEKVMHAQFLRDIDNELNSGKMINVRVGPG